MPILKSQNKAEPAELPDDTEIEGVANYQMVDPCKPVNPQPGYRYFAAAKDDDGTRPDSVGACEAMGYEVCTEEKIPSKECVLMRMPLEQWAKQKRSRLRMANRAVRSEASSIQGVPDEATYRAEGHNKGKK